MRLLPYFKYQSLKWITFSFLTIWALTSTAIALRSNTKIILISLEEDGTRILRDGQDPALAKEKLNFLKEYLFYAYQYTEANYDRRITQAGSLMSDKLWKEKEEEFQRIWKKMKESPITQTARILDLRDLGEGYFEADIDVQIQSRLLERSTKTKVTLRIQPHKRTTENPYGWEIQSLHESEFATY